MAEYICYACGNEGPGHKKKRGSGKAELWIYLLLMVPGPFYTIWRRVALKRTCANCGMDTVVKVTSKQGQIAKRRVDMELGIMPTRKTQTSKPAEQLVTTPRPAERVETKKPVNPEEW